MVESLLIIGNGFDKKCGLKSSFSDYYEKLFSENNGQNIYAILFTLFKNKSWNVEEIDQIYTDHMDLFEKITMWDLYFFLNLEVKDKTIMWYDVEKSIKESFYKKDIKVNLYDNNYWAYFMSRYTQIHKRNKSEKLYIKNKLDLPVLFFIRYQLANKASLFKGDNYQNLTESLFIEFLRNELERFEQFFRVYLKEVSADENYSRKKNYYKSKLRIEKTNVLSFNYTHLSLGNGEFCENVHGSLNENLSIIGIDGSFIESTDKYYQFTKTYRKIEQFTRSDSKNIVDVLDINIKRLIFYGHSLNEQDYSYFKSIFDFYNLYGDKKSNNNLHLVFYYSIYEGKDALTIKKDIFTSVIHLIHAYDKTYKSDHEMGNNLLHKLLIEKRIEIREFKPDDEQTFLASII